MGVYIKGMEMPKCCQDCKLIDCEHFIKATEWIPSKCPIVEVNTRHGRLIDADKTWACALEQVENMPPELEITEREKDITLAVISGLILQMPTVIEAEGE